MPVAKKAPVKATKAVAAKVATKAATKTAADPWSKPAPVKRTRPVVVWTDDSELVDAHAAYVKLRTKQLGDASNAAANINEITRATPFWAKAKQDIGPMAAGDWALALDKKRGAKTFTILIGRNGDTLYTASGADVAKFVFYAE